MIIQPNGYEYKELNRQIRLYSRKGEKTEIHNCLGQRFIGAGLDENADIEIYGIAGNALGAYMNGARINVHGNAQDALGDTMNDGTISVCGSAGDALGYAMRGGKIYIKENVGYRAGIHMKEYGEKIPIIIIGGTAGSFLGEYQAGGIIVVLGKNSNDAEGRAIIGDFSCTGMHGGRLYLRGDYSNNGLIDLPSQVSARLADEEDMRLIDSSLAEFCALFDMDFEELRSSCFTVITPDTNNPYRQMYVDN